MLALLQGPKRRLKLRFWAAAASWTFLIGCGGASSSSEGDALRVAAPFGLSSFRDLNQLFGGSNANAVVLLLDPIGTYAEVIEVRDRLVYMRPRPGIEHSPPDLARALRARGLVRADIDPAGQIIAELRDNESAKLLVSAGGFALAPYEFEGEDLEAGWVRLRARGHVGVEVIELIAVPADEQWRRLHARAVDVVPFSPASSERAYEGMASVRTVEYPVTAYIGLEMNTSAPELSDPLVRRRIAAMIDRPAVAAVACGNTDCAAEEIAPMATDAALPAAVDIMVLQSDSVAVDAARVVRLQLEAGGLPTRLLPVSIEELGSRLVERRYHLVLVPLPAGAQMLPLLRSDSIYNMTGWRNPDFDAAADQGDVQRALAILADEAPALPLFWDRQFAAIDAKFCGGQPVDASWRWLADVHPCDRGESQ